MGVLILRTIPQRIFPIHSKVLESRDDPRLLLSDERAMISRGFRVLQLLRINVISLERDEIVRSKLLFHRSFEWKRGSLQ